MIETRTERNKYCARAFRDLLGLLCAHVESFASRRRKRFLASMANQGKERPYITMSVTRRARATCTLARTRLVRGNTHLDLIADILTRKRERKFKDAFIEFQHGPKSPQVPFRIPSNIRSLHFHSHIHFLSRW